MPTPDQLRRAADWLAEYALALRRCSVVEGAWTDREARADHDEMLALARLLREEAGE